MSINNLKAGKAICYFVKYVNLENYGKVRGRLVNERFCVGGSELGLKMLDYSLIFAESSFRYM